MGSGIFLNRFGFQTKSVGESRSDLKKSVGESRSDPEKERRREPERPGKRASAGPIAPAYGRAIGEYIYRLLRLQGATTKCRCRGRHGIPVTEIFVPRWLLILGAIALIALVAGYVTFGGANMGR